MRARERARVESKKKKKGSDGELAAFCPSEQTNAATFHVDIISDSDAAERHTSRLRRGSASDRLVPFFGFLCAPPPLCSVISDAIGSISKVKPSFVEASARQSPSVQAESSGGVFTIQ